MNKDGSPRDLAGLRAELASSPEFDEYKDTAVRRQAFYRQMAEHSDPMWREIGQQLRDGRIRPWDVLTTPQYREHLQAGMADGVARFTQLVDAVENRLLGGAEQRPEDTDEAPEPDHEQPPAPTRSRAPVYNFDPDWDD